MKQWILFCNNRRFTDYTETLFDEQSATALVSYFATRSKSMNMWSISQIIQCENSCQ